MQNPAISSKKQIVTGLDHDMIFIISPQRSNRFQKLHEACTTKLFDVRTKKTQTTLC